MTAKVNTKNTLFIHLTVEEVRYGMIYMTYWLNTVEMPVLVCV